MKQIKVNSLALRNFKGAKYVNVDLSFNAIIEGDNGTGKTTLFDAFNYLLYGKNSANEKIFGIKPVDHLNNPLHGLEYEVSGVISVDDQIYQLRRVFKEKYAKRRGSEEIHFTGNETELFINDVPKTATEYAAFINELIPDRISRLITDPLYFNVHLKWEERRLILTEIAGNISDDEILFEYPELDQIKNILDSNVPGDKLKNKKLEITNKRKKLRDDLETIPARLDEVDRTIPEELNWSEIEESIRALNQEKNDIDTVINNAQSQANEKYESIRKLVDKKNALEIELMEENARTQRELNAARYETINRSDELQRELNAINSNIAEIESLLTAGAVEIKNFNKQNEILRESYDKLNVVPIVTDVNKDCPACGQNLPSDRVEADAKDQFEQMNKKRVESLRRITDEARNNNAKIQAIQEGSTTLSVKLADLKIQRDQKLNELSLIEIPYQIVAPLSEKANELKTDIELISELITEPEPIDNNDQIAIKRNIEDQIIQLEKQLLNRDRIEDAKKRKLELQDQQKTLSQALALLEKTENQIDRFLKIKMQFVENRINELFEYVNFKMFDRQINGIDNPTCTCLLNGVEFSDLNTAGRINAGVDIIKTLQKYYEISAPVFIDNRESVTRLLPMNCQVINLVKVEGVKQLTVKQ